MRTNRPLRNLLGRESLYLLAGLFFGGTAVPAIGSLYFHEDVVLAYRQFFAGLFDPETTWSALGFVFGPYLLAQLIRSTVRSWKGLRS